MRKQLLTLSLIITLCSFTGIAYGKPASEPGLTILHTNDVHGMLVPFDYTALGKNEKDVGGTARRVALIRKLKKESVKPTIVMDAGDVFVRGPMEKLEGVPDFDVMNSVPYDVITLGNNEFKGDQYTGKPSPEGMKILERRMKQAHFPILCANVFYKDTGKPIALPYIIVQKEQMKIGIFGVTAPKIAGYAQTVALDVKDPIIIAKQIVAELEPKCNFIIALTHIGYDLDLQLAREIPSIDAIIGGDSHTWLPIPVPVKALNPVGPKWWVGGPIVCQDGEWGKCLGRLDLAVRKDNTGQYLVTRYQAKLINVDASIKPAGDVENIIKNAILRN